ncbi:MAG TPA: UDP-N-acetylmuramate--L-alanine ligase [Actinomycetota bacterium]|nr:UDP-N-acetylmuramate--L-alanine ligase [Actinomycetota bacterium]
MPDLSGIRRVHLVGIGGAGMSGIARILLARGVDVSGSDLKDGPALPALRAEGAAVAVGHSANLVGNAESVVVSTAIGPYNPEVVEARSRGIPVLARAQVLAALMRDRRGIAVAGTHGKTTTTSMVAVIIELAGLDPTYVIGGDLNESGSNARSGRGEIFVAEADESDGSFLLLSPEIAVVTNIEEDHLDFFSGRVEIEAAFAEFCRRATVVVACGDDPAVRRVLEAAAVSAVTYGEGPENDVRLEEVKVRHDGGACVVRWEGGGAEITVPLPGRHYLLNAAAALTVARHVGVDPVDAAAALATYRGVRRRYERRGSAAGADFVDDYAHHPTEIAATLASARAASAGGDGIRRIVAVFQPHRYTRTAAMWRELGGSLADADLAVVTDVYAAGELPVPGITGKLVVDALAEAAPGKRIVYLPHRADLASFLAREVRTGDLVLTLGAGDVTMVSEETLARLGAAPAATEETHGR